LIYRDAYLPTKKRREVPRRESITIAEAVKLTRAALFAERRNLP
jgi:hypothetical protein